MNKPLFFSVVIPTYNRAHLLGKTLDSVLAQQYTHFEVIVIDDGSTDNTQALVENYKSPHIVYLWKENEERGIARNKGIELAKGDYITFLDSDDLFYPHHLTHASQVLEKLEYPHFYRQAYEVKDEKGGVIEEKNKVQGNANELILSGNYFSCIGVFLKREVTSNCRFSLENIAPSEDWEYWLRLSVRYTFFYDNTITSCMLNHSGRSMLHFDEEKSRKVIKLLLQELQKDALFIQKKGHCLPIIHSQMLTLLCLKKVVAGHNQGILQELISSFQLSPKELFRKRTLAILKYYFINIFHI